MTGLRLNQNLLKVPLYIGGKSIEAVEEAVLQHGGSIALPRMPIPGVGWLFYAKDTEGNIFGVTQPDPNAA